MARFVQVMAMTVLVTGALIGATRVAAANPVQDYRDVMRSFVPDIQTWANDTSTLVEAAATKPELGCSEEMVDLAHRGIWVSQDMAGTAAMAPTALRASHDRATQALVKLTEAAQGSCADGVGSARVSVHAMTELRRALAHIQYFVGGPDQSGEIADLSVSGS